MASTIDRITSLRLTPRLAERLETAYAQIVEDAKHSGLPPISMHAMILRLIARGLDEKGA